jgi:hypothetical protein
MTSARGRCADCRYLRRIDSRDGRRRRCQRANVEVKRLGE